MITTETTKGLRERPMLFGIRGELIMPMIAIIVAESVLFVVFMVLFFFKKQYGIAFFGLIFWIVFVVATIIGFRIYSTDKMYKKVKKRADIITNKDLTDYL